MSGIGCLLLAVLSIWDYPIRFPVHERLRRQFIAALSGGNAAEAERVCRQGTNLLPDDPTWHFHLACSLAHLDRQAEAALDELERAIDLGFRDRGQIEQDADIKLLKGSPRYAELLAYVDEIKDRPIVGSPMFSTVPATGVFGSSVALGAPNLSWDFTVGTFVAQMDFRPGEVVTGNTGDLYMNRDGEHAPLRMESFPGLTRVRFDGEGRKRQLDRCYPNVLFPYPVFGNCSMALTTGPLWRSLPRALMTVEVQQLGKMATFYLSNQTWVFPSNFDTAPVGTNGDLFASIAPYWITTAGRSFSDLPYLHAALEASRSFDPGVKKEIIRRRLLAPTIQTLIRKTLVGVRTEADYLTEKAHPTALPPCGADIPRLKAAAQAMTAETIPPLVFISVQPAPVTKPSAVPELTYASVCAWAFVLRAEEDERAFLIQAKGAEEFAFVQTHGTGIDVSIQRTRKDAARVTVRRSSLSPINRLDIAVFGRNAKTGWGAPSYVSFARMGEAATYTDPVLAPAEKPETK